MPFDYRYCFTLNLQIPRFGRTCTCNGLNATFRITQSFCCRMFNCRLSSSPGTPRSYILVKTTILQEICSSRSRNNFCCNQTIQITRILIGMPNQAVPINADTRFCSLCKQLIDLIKFQIPFRIDHRTVLHGISYRQIIKVLIHNGSCCLVTKIFIHPHSDAQLKVRIG